MSFFGSSFLDDVGDVLRFAAPTVGRIVGGPLGGMVAETLSTALLGKPDGSEEEIAAAIRRADPDQMIKLKEVEAQLLRDLKRADINLAQINAGDRDSARRRQVAMRDWSPNVLGVLIILGFFGLLGTLMRFTPPDGTLEIFMIMIGVLGGMVGQVCNYFFGSSRGSKQKNDTIERLKAGGAT